MQVPSIPGFQIMRPLGSGGMAHVWLAMQTSLERKVALKLLKIAPGDDHDRMQKRFIREARTLAKLNHRNICAIFDIGQAGDDVYLAMEYLDGGTLLERMRVGLSLGEAIGIVVQIASGLKQAHAQGIIHRDLKPANVMMRGNVPVLTDFGVARELSAATRITTDNMIVGTPVYMSPEQAQGGEVDGRADLYALGILLHELLTGRVPYSGDSPIAVCMQHLTAPLPVLPPRFAMLQPVLDRLLAKSPAERYASAEAFLEALRKLVVGNEVLKHSLALDNQGTTDQLRALGFSIDAPRDTLYGSGERIARMPTAEQSRQRITPPEAPGEAASTSTPVGHGRGARPKAGLPRLLIAALIALPLLIGGGWFLLGRGPSETQQTALNALAREFDRLVGEEMIFEPPARNAAQVLGEMRRLPAAPITRSREEALIGAVRRQARDALAAGDAYQVNQLTMRAAAVLSPEDMETLRRAIEEERGQLAQAASADELLQRIEATLKSPPLTLEPVYGLLKQLRSQLPASDPRRATVESGVLSLGLQRVRARLEARDLRMASLLLQLLDQHYPGDTGVIALQTELQGQTGPKRILEAVATIDQLLSSPGLDDARLRAILAEWQFLPSAGSERVLLRPRIQDRVDAAVATERQAGREDSARALTELAARGLGGG
ncbi:MAG: serine/threonine protein kinase [Xanthomonadales bacterium]|jgi:serine/threonine protein kinase|nr:serine/threonine protein kinase [Xanthomonadales bacterium]